MAEGEFPETVGEETLDRSIAQLDSLRGGYAESLLDTGNDLPELIVVVVGVVADEVSDFIEGRQVRRVTHEPSVDSARRVAASATRISEPLPFAASSSITRQ